MRIDRAAWRGIDLIPKWIYSSSATGAGEENDNDKPSTGVFRRLFTIRGEISRLTKLPAANKHPAQPLIPRGDEAKELAPPPLYAIPPFGLHLRFHQAFSSPFSVGFSLRSIPLLPL